MGGMEMGLRADFLLHSASRRQKDMRLKFIASVAEAPFAACVAVGSTVSAVSVCSLVTSGLHTIRSDNRHRSG